MPSAHLDYITCYNFSKKSISFRAVQDKQASCLILSRTLLTMGMLHEWLISKFRQCPLKWMYNTSGDTAWTPRHSLAMLEAPSYPWPLMFLISRPAFVWSLHTSEAIASPVTQGKAENWIIFSHTSLFVLTNLMHKDTTHDYEKLLHGACRNLA